MGCMLLVYTWSGGNSICRNAVREAEKRKEKTATSKLSRALRILKQAVAASHRIVDAVFSEMWLCDLKRQKQYFERTLLLVFTLLVEF